MCGSMVDIQSPTDEIRRGKKRKKIEKNHREKYNEWPALFHRAAIMNFNGNNDFRYTMFLHSESTFANK